MISDDNGNPVFSVIVTSRGGERLEFLRRLLQTLADACSLVEVLLVAQQPEIGPIWCPPLVEGLSVKVFDSTFISLSKARNLALPFARGRYLIFGDDDAYYPNDAFVALRDEILRLGEPEAVCGRTMDPATGRAYGSHRKHLQGGMRVTSMNAFRIPVSITLAVRKDSARMFDERLGLGARFFSGEETDLVLDIISRGKIFVAAKFVAYHPDKAYPPTLAFRYAVGTGVVIIKAIRLRKQIGVMAEALRLCCLSLVGIFYHAIFGRGSRAMACVFRLGGFMSGLAFGMRMEVHPLAVPLWKSGNQTGPTNFRGER